MIGLLVVAGLLIVQYAVLLLLLKTIWKDYSARTEHLPTVSILVAARNEEDDLPRLLASLDDLDYPEEKLEILIADDQSTDRTATLAAAWAGSRVNRKVFFVSPEQVELYQRNGKANALAILGREACGELLFFTDADCEVPKSWLRTGIGCFGQQTGLLIGITQVKSSSFFGKMQEVEWWNTLGIVKVVTDLRLPTTGLGNNMVISKAAYLASGGFEGLAHSVTEDLEISKAIRAAGFDIRQQVSEGFLVKTKAEDGWMSFLRQRKRWVTGAMTLSLPWKIMLILQFLFFPSLFILASLDWRLGMIWVMKVFFQSLFLGAFANRAERKIGLFPLIYFDFYQILSLCLTILYYFWPSKVQWKSRSYP
jgi:cellulose synthase/poly-beta-1,6-N-acetylglucosamine synthase-like glycosyltransferase